MRIKIVIVILIILFIRDAAIGEDLMISPDIHPPLNYLPQREGKERDGYSPLSAFLEFSVKFFQTFISPVDGDRCAMYPTCSAYSRQVIRKYGAIKGFVMTADRLIHEEDEYRFAPLIKNGWSVRYYDPVENNNFWSLK